MGKNVLKEKSFVFAVRIVKMYSYLAETKREFVISKRLLRSGTTVGSLIREAQNAPKLYPYSQAKELIIHRS